MFVVVAEWVTTSLSPWSYATQRHKNVCRNTQLPPVHLSSVAVAGSPVPLELNQELHALARTAIAG